MEDSQQKNRESKQFSCRASELAWSAVLVVLILGRKSWEIRSAKRLKNWTKLVRYNPVGGINQDYKDSGTSEVVIKTETEQDYTWRSTFGDEKDGSGTKTWGSKNLGIEQTGTWSTLGDRHLERNLGNLLEAAKTTTGLNNKVVNLNVKVLSGLVCCG